jgi:diacylglycerol kinase (ATP)
VKVLVVRNPRSGQGDPGFPAFLDELASLGAKASVRLLEAHTPLDELLADASNFDRIVAAGGDGTVSGVAHALRDSGIPILAYPAGTANLLALNLRIPSDPVELARLVVYGIPLVTDLAELECVAGRPAAQAVTGEDELPSPPEAGTTRVGFAMIAGAGFDAAMIAGSEDLKPRLGIGAYVASALAQMLPTVAQISLKLDGEVIERSGIGVMLVNFARIQGDLKIVSEADAHDGLLEVVVLKTRTAAGLVPVLARAAAEKIGINAPEPDGLMESFRAREVSVITDPPLPLQFDGEVLEGTTPLTARVLPGAAVFLVPPGSDELEEHTDSWAPPGS